MTNNRLLRLLLMIILMPSLTWAKKINLKGAYRQGHAFGKSEAAHKLIQTTARLPLYFGSDFGSARFGLLREQGRILLKHPENEGRPDLLNPSHHPLANAYINLENWLTRATYGDTANWLSMEADSFAIGAYRALRLPLTGLVTFINEMRQEQSFADTSTASFFDSRISNIQRLWNAERSRFDCNRLFLESDTRCSQTPCTPKHDDENVAFYESSSN